MIEPKPVRQIPPWVSGVVAVGCAIVLGWFVWTSWLGAGPRERIVIMEKGPNDKVTTWRGRPEIHWGGVKVVVNKPDTQEGEYEFSFVDTENRDMPPEQVRVLKAMAELEARPLQRAAIGLTPEQFEAVKEIRKGAAGALPPDDQARFKGLWLTYESAKGDLEKRAAAEKKLLKAVNDIEPRMKQLILKSAAERAGKAQSILTPDQWRKLEEEKK